MVVPEIWAIRRSIRTARCAHGGQARAPLGVGDRPLCVSLRPPHQRLAVRRGERSVTDDLGGARPARARAVDDEDLRRQLDLDPKEEALALRDPGFRAASPSARLDGFIGEDGIIRFVEYNAESPAGMAYNDELAQVFASLPVMKQFRAKFPCSFVPTRGRQLTAMLRAHRSRSDRAPTIAIVDWRGLPTLTEFEMFQRYFESRGVPTVICAPDDLTYSRGTLRARGKPINSSTARLDERAPREGRRAGPCARYRGGDRREQLPREVLQRS